MQYNTIIRDRVLESINSSDYGLCITEVARNAKTTRITARKHLERLKREGEINENVHGRVRIFHLDTIKERLGGSGDNEK